MYLDSCSELRRSAWLCGQLGSPLILPWRPRCQTSIPSRCITCLYYPRPSHPLFYPLFSHLKDFHFQCIDLVLPCGGIHNGKRGFEAATASGGLEEALGLNAWVLYLHFRKPHSLVFLMLGVMGWPPALGWGITGPSLRGGKC